MEDERIISIAKSESKFCARTNEFRFIIWDESEPSEYLIVEDEEYYTVEILTAQSGRFYYRGKLTGAPAFSLFQLSSAGVKTDLIAHFDLPTESYSGGRLQFIDDSLCLTLPGLNLLIKDTTTGVETLLNEETLGIPYGVSQMTVSQSGQSLFLSGVIHHKELAEPYVYQLSREGYVKVIETNADYFTGLSTSDRGWATARGDYIFIDERYYYVVDEEGYHRYPYENLSLIHI